MRHGKAHRKLGRTTAHRTAMFANMSASLIKHEQIVTTLPKAKELRPFVEKLVTLAKRGEPRFEIRALLMGDKARFAEIDRQSLRNVVDAGQASEQPIHPLQRDIARACELVVGVGDDRRVAGELVAAFGEPRYGVEAELLDDLRLLAELLPRICQMQAKRMHRLVER